MGVEWSEKLREMSGRVRVSSDRWAASGCTRRMTQRSHRSAPLLCSFSSCSAVSLRLHRLRLRCRWPSDHRPLLSLGSSAPRGSDLPASALSLSVAALGSTDVSGRSSRSPRPVDGGKQHEQRGGETVQRSSSSGGLAASDKQPRTNPLGWTVRKHFMTGPSSGISKRSVTKRVCNV